MESVIKQLVKIGHGMGAEVANDEPAVAKLLAELSSALDVQYERANALEAKCAALAAENAGLAAEVQSVKVMNDCLSEELRGYESDGAFEGPKMHLLWWKVQTPATKAFLAEVRAQESAPLVRALTVIANSEQHDGETVVCDFDTLISVAAGALRDHYAAQLRKGVQS